MAPARFADGETAKLHSVEVSLGVAALLIRHPETGTTTSWPLDTVATVEKPHRSRPLHLRCVPDDGSRLWIDDAGLATVVAEALSGRPNPRRHERLGARWWATFVVGAAGLAALLYFGVPRASDWLAAFVPQSWERRIGAAVLPPIVDYLAAAEDQPAICNAPEGEAALRHILRRLEAGVDGDAVFTVGVADLGMVNAFALPGGYVVLTRGLIEDAESPEALAGVIAHEMAHGLNHHVTRGIIRNTGYSAIVDALTGGTVSPSVTATLATQLVVTAYSREDELEADRGAVAILRKAGIRAQPFADFLAAVGGKDGGATALLSTHPGAAERIAALRDLEGGETLPLDADAWESLRAICDATQTPEAFLAKAP
jgi:Zn-dependent protease with chaperone function